MPGSAYSTAFEIQEKSHSTKAVFSFSQKEKERISHFFILLFASSH
jgi:hypothetical protein